MDILEARAKIDALDLQIIDALSQRMNLSAQIAAYKKDNHLPIYVPAREQEIMQNISGKVDESMCAYIQKIYATVFETSRDYQMQIHNEVI